MGPSSLTPSDRALLALRDCGVIRCRGGRPAFGTLVSRGQADVSRTFRDGGWVYDYRLTDAGREFAAFIFRSPK